MLVSTASFYGSRPAVDVRQFLALSFALGERRTHCARRDGDHVRPKGRFCTILHDKIAERFGKPLTRVTLERRWLWFTVRPHASMIAIVPPR